MLLQSSFPACDSRQARRPRTRLQLSTADLFSPPATPRPQQVSSPLTNIFSTCRSLQAFILDPAPVPAVAPAAPLMATPERRPQPVVVSYLSTPPPSHTPSPTKLRLRSAGAVKPDVSRQRVVKRVPPRGGANKRRRALDDDMGRADDVLSASESEPCGVDSDMDLSDISEPRTPTTASSTFAPAGPSTPKRTRLAPETIPLGLARRDFHDLYLMNGGGGAEDPVPLPAADVEMEADGSEWTAEDDRLLVELVLEKLRLSKTEWQECARSLGKDRHSLGRRWRTLMAQSHVGLKSKTSRRARLHSTWR